MLGKVEMNKCQANESVTYGFKQAPDHDQIKDERHDSQYLVPRIKIVTHTNKETIDIQKRNQK